MGLALVNDLCHKCQSSFEMSLDFPPFLGQTVKTQNPMNGELSQGPHTKAVQQRVQSGRGPAAGAGRIGRRGGAGIGGKSQRAAPLAPGFPAGNGECVPGYKLKVTAAVVADSTESDF